MVVYFADSSALAKRYVTEIGTAWLRALVAPLSGNIIVIVRITAAELIAVLARRERGRSLAPADALAARNAIRTHLLLEYQIVEVSETVIERAMTLAETYGLRGYDAVQLAAALDVNDRYVSAGMAALTLISADAELNAAAIAAGLIVEDPNAHP